MLIIVFLAISNLDPLIHTPEFSQLLQNFSHFAKQAFGGYVHSGKSGLYCIDVWPTA